MLSDSGYINGIVTTRDLEDMFRHIAEPIFPSITLKGLEYLAENSFMAKRISLGLSQREIQAANKEVKSFQSDLNRKCEELCRRLAAEGIAIAQAHIGSSGFGKYIHLSSEITPQQAGCRAVFCMEDSQTITRRWQTKEGIKSATLSPALLLEFGSGLEAENPAGIAGVGQGSFPGQTHAFDSSGWSYMDLGGMWHHTTGVEPEMPMYFAGKELRDKVLSIARDTFK